MNENDWILVARAVRGYGLGDGIFEAKRLHREALTRALTAQAFGQTLALLAEAEAVARVSMTDWNKQSHGLLRALDVLARLPTPSVLAATVMGDRPAELDDTDPGPTAVLHIDTDERAP